MANWSSGICRASLSAGVALASLSGLWLLQAQEAAPDHGDCSFFGAKRARYLKSGLAGVALETHETGRLTADVIRHLSTATGAATREIARPSIEQMELIDRHIFGTLRDAAVAPAGRASDWEFLRRATLDLTGRIPTAERASEFAADARPDKRTRLVDELLASPAWVDKWTMFFGDLFGNTANTAQVNRYASGRNAFHAWIRQSLASGKPYSQMARELIATAATNTWEPAQGAANFTVGGFVTGGPVQDVWDQQAVNVSEAFLGVAHMNCVLCHDGRGHLDTLSLWGRSTARTQAWGMAAFFSGTRVQRVPVGDSRLANVYYWRVTDQAQGNPTYALNTTTGNRPAREPIGAMRAVTPEYPFSGAKPRAGENYRAVLAREVTGDVQFSRAAVNYLWRHFMGRGFVEPANQFDLARLDPDNPPPSPWSLQPSHPRLLNELAQDFSSNGHDLKRLMRQIALSEAYQMSSRYSGEWNPAWERLYARKLVRRLWAEEVHDAVALSSGLFPSYRVLHTVPADAAPRGEPVPPEYTYLTATFAMQLPDTRNLPDNGGVAAFLDAFLRGNRDDEERRGDGSVIQALSMMNDPVVVSRIRSVTRDGNASLLSRALAADGDAGLVERLYLAVLSRPPSSEERQTALASLRDGNRPRRAEDLLWALYNKVDFLFNY